MLSVLVWPNHIKRLRLYYEFFPRRLFSHQVIGRRRLPWLEAGLVVHVRVAGAG